VDEDLKLEFKNLNDRISEIKKEIEEIRESIATVRTELRQLGVRDTVDL
jgi:prefoldin subunit 5